nr:uncharacterized protein LOC128703917 isoform X2 [Cherax quadricarinatus]XP_053654766.1 uncharacterized protein LOC128703917 isoform X2 [Cherax quadricarinatus]
MAFQYKRKVLFEDGKNTTYCYVRIKPAMRTDESTQQLPSTSRAGQVEDKTPEKMVITREQRLRMERSYQRALRIREERMARNAENAKNPVVDNSAEDDGVISINSRGYEVRPLHNDGQRILANVPEPPSSRMAVPTAYTVPSCLILHITMTFSKFVHVNSAGRRICKMRLRGVTQTSRQFPPF